MKQQEITKISENLLVTIYDEVEVKKKPLWFTRLTQLHPNIKSNKVLKAMLFLDNYGFLKHQYGETTKGRAGRLMFLCSEYKSFAKGLYEKKILGSKEE